VRDEPLTAGQMASLSDLLPHVQSGYEGMTERDAKFPPYGKVRLTEALERLVHLPLRSLEQPDQAAQWREKLDALLVVTKAASNDAAPEAEDTATPASSDGK
jgi:hypothetical protein